MSGYRDSHRATRHVEAYDREFVTPGTPDEVLWHLEQRLLPGLLTGLGDGGRPPARLLDFAAGTGRISHLLETALPEARVDGVDISPEMLALARRRCDRVRLVEGDITRDPSLVPGPYEVITAFRFFLRAEPALRADALAAIRARLGPGGHLVANFHRNPASLRGRWLQARAATRGLPFLTREEVTALLADGGFEVVRLVGYQHGFYRSHPRGDVPVRKRVDERLAGVPALARFGLSFLVVARPTGARVVGPAVGAAGSAREAHSSSG